MTYQETHSNPALTRPVVNALNALAARERLPRADVFAVLDGPNIAAERVGNTAPHVLAAIFEIAPSCAAAFFSRPSI